MSILFIFFLLHYTQLKNYTYMKYVKLYMYMYMPNHCFAVEDLIFLLYCCMWTYMELRSQAQERAWPEIAGR